MDFDPVFVEDVNERMEEKWSFECRLHDMLSGPLDDEFDAAYSLDVLEHISREHEDVFLENIVSSLKDEGILIVGTPSLQSQKHASEASRIGHVNCKDEEDLRRLMKKYFNNVLIFSMNDEIVHTGFEKMAHYLFCVCCVVK